MPGTRAVEDGALELDCGFVRLMGTNEGASRDRLLIGQQSVERSHQNRCTLCKGRMYGDHLGYLVHVSRRYMGPCMYVRTSKLESK